MPSPTRKPRPPAKPFKKPLSAVPVKPPPTRRVVCAAIKQGNFIICGVRHHDLLMNEVMRNVAVVSPQRVLEQGFVDNRGEWLTRQEAWQVAKAAGQIVRYVGGDEADGGTLYSENLY